MAIDFNLLGRSERSRNSTSNIHDVYMSIRKAGNENYRVIAFVFYNNSFRKFLYKSSYVQLGVDQDKLRIYFKPSEDSRDIRMAQYHTGKVDESRREMQKSISLDLAKIFESFKGCYDLRYDNDVCLYYIDLNMKY